MAATTPDPPSAARERLRRLEQLKAEGLLTDEEYATRRSIVLDDATQVAGSPPSRAHSPSASASPRAAVVPPHSRSDHALREEVEKRTRRGWHIVSESTDGVQLRKPKHFSFGWALLWFVLAIFPFVVYLLWHWSKKDRYVLLSVGPDGELIASDRSRLWGFVRSYGRWASTRPRAWQRVAAFGAPALVVLVLVGRVMATAASSGGNAPQTALVAGAIPTAAPTAPRSLRIGDTWYATRDGWEITVSDVTTTGAFQGGIVGLPHVARGVYLAVAVTMTNTADGAHALGQNRFTLVDATGQTYDASGFNRSYGGGSYGEDIGFGTNVSPGENLSGILFFDVPPTVNGLDLKVIGGGVFSLGDLRGGGLVRSFGNSDVLANPSATPTSHSSTSSPLPAGPAVFAVSSASTLARTPASSYGGLPGTPSPPVIPPTAAPTQTPTPRPAASPTLVAVATPAPPPTAVVYHPSIALNPTSGPPGTTVMISGAGFPANDASISIFLDLATGSTLDHVSTNGAGQISYTWTIPTSAIPGTWGATAWDLSGDMTPAKAYFTIPPPTITLTPSNAGVGQTVTVRGSGFSAGQPFMVVAMELSQQLGSGTTSASGDIKLTFTVPTTSRTSLTIFGGLPAVASEQPQVTLTIS